MMEKLFVKKKDGTLEAYNPDKILIAVSKSADRVGVTFTAKEQGFLLDTILKAVSLKEQEIIPVLDMHSIVEVSLDAVNPKVAQSYRSYRDHKKQFADLWARCAEKANTIMYLGSKENANVNSQLVSTKRSLIFNEFNTELYRMFFLSDREKEAEKDGYIYIHDKSARRDTMNCCLFDVNAVISGGFYMNNQWYNEPKTLDTLGDVLGDVVLAAASQQYGGFTVPEIDKLLSPYAEKTWQKSYERYISYVDEDTAKKLAEEDTVSQMKGCFQGWEYKFNTVSSSRGDYPFITFTFGLATDKWGKLASKICLQTRAAGQGRAGLKKPVLFPKLVFLYDENLHGEGKESEDIFLEGIACSKKTMYPDYLSLTGSGEAGSVPFIYRTYGKAVSPMGCRAFLSPWFKNGGIYASYPDDEPVFVGRFNIGVVSLHLPMILAKARQESGDFYEVLDYYLEMIRKIHLKTFDYLGKLKASINPLAFCEGGFYGGHLGEDDEIAPVLDSATASFGITALNELQRLYNGKSLSEDNAFSLEVMQYINNKVSEFKREDGRLYAIYGTPAENLCGKQVEQFRKKYGIIEYVSDKAYVSNSFHCHVSEKLEPSRKQDLEEPFWDLFKGGRIQYCRYPVAYNTNALKTLIRRAMKKGFYEGVNMSLAYCEECGYQQLEMDSCPRCHSSNITKIDRMNGYLSFSRTMVDTTNARKNLAETDLDELLQSVDLSAKGSSRLSEHKNIEIQERVSM